MRQWMKDSATAHRRWGHKHAWARTQVEGIVTGRDTFRRLWRAEGLRERSRKAHKPRAMPAAPGQGKCFGVGVGH